MRHYLNRIREDGLKAILKRRFTWYRNSLQYNNYWIGRTIELLGNRILLSGMWFSLDTPGSRQASDARLLSRDTKRRNVDS